VIAGTEEGILMIEGEASFLPEEIILGALKVTRRDARTRKP